MTKIENHMFWYCENLKNIVFSEGVTSIGKYICLYCINLESITIPNSVTEIGESAFSNCRSLKSVYCKAQIPPSVGTELFYSAPTSEATLYIPIGSKEAYSTAEHWKDFGTIEEVEF